MSEQTLVLLKPDTTSRGIVGDVLRYFERKGLRVVRVQSIDKPSLGLCRLHYIEHEGKDFFPRNIKFLHSGLVIAVVLSGDDAICLTRKTIGATDPAKALPGTIRGDLTSRKTKLPYNLVHGSDSIEAAKREIGLWFSG